MKLFGIVFLERFYNHLTGTRIVARFAAVATTPRTRLSLWLPTTTRPRFLLDLHLNLSLTLQILCVLYGSDPPCRSRCFLTLRRLLSASFAARRLWISAFNNAN
jgi:hypothetical protein